MDIQEANRQHELLNGNINRMFLTYNYDELNRMYLFAKKRLDDFYTHNYNRIMNGISESKGD